MRSPITATSWTAIAPQGARPPLPTSGRAAVRDGRDGRGDARPWHGLVLRRGSGALHDIRVTARRSASGRARTRRWKARTMDSTSAAAISSAPSASDSCAMPTSTVRTASCAEASRPMVEPQVAGRHGAVALHRHLGDAAGLAEHRQYPPSSAVRVALPTLCLMTGPPPRRTSSARARAARRSSDACRAPCRQRAAAKASSDASQVARSAPSASARCSSTRASHVESARWPRWSRPPRGRRARSTWQSRRRSTWRRSGASTAPNEEHRLSSRGAAGGSADVAQPGRRAGGRSRRRPTR